MKQFFILPTLSAEEVTDSSILSSGQITTITGLKKKNNILKKDRISASKTVVLIYMDNGFYIFVVVSFIRIRKYL